MRKRRILHIALLLMAALSCSAALPALAGETDVNAPDPPRYNLSGVVLGAGNVPLRGALVTISTASPRIGQGIYCPYCYMDCGKRALTRKDGSFTIKSVAPDLIFRLLVVKDGYTPKFVRDIDPAKSACAIHLDKEPRMNPATEQDITGVILDPQGRPIEGASVEPLGLDLGRRVQYVEYHVGSQIVTKPLSVNDEEVVSIQSGVGTMAASDQSGRFRLPCQKSVLAYSSGPSPSPTPVSSICAKIEARGMASAIVELAPGKKNVVPMTVGATVTGKVVDRAGRPIPGAVVEVQQADQSMDHDTGWNLIATDSRGRFLLPCVSPDSLSLICVHMASLANTGCAVASEQFTTPGDEKSIDLGVFHTVPAASITGHLKTSNGVALPTNARIELVRNKSKDVQQVIVGPDGSFTFHGVPMGEGFMLLSDMWIDGKPYESWINVDVPAGCAAMNEDLTLAPMQ